MATSKFAELTPHFDDKCSYSVKIVQGIYTPYSPRIEVDDTWV